MKEGRKSSKKSAKKRSKNKVEKQQFGTFDLFLFMILAAFIGGSVIISAKISLEVIPPFTLTFFIFLITYLITASIAGKNKQIGSNNFNDNFFPAFFIIASLFALFFALSYTTALMVAVIYAAVPLISITYLKVFNNRRLVCDQKMGMLLSGMGLCLVVFQPIIQLYVGNGLDFALEIIKGNLLALLAAIFSTLYIFNRQKYTSKTVTPVSIVFYASLMAMLISVAPMLFIEFQDFDFVSKITLEHVGMIMWLSIVGIFLFNLLYQFFIRNKFVISNYYCMLPIFGVVIVIAVLGEVLPWLVIVGAVMMIIGGKMTADKIKSKSVSKLTKKKSVKNSVKKEGGFIESIDSFFNQSHLGRISEVSFYGASIVFSAGLAIAASVSPLAIFFGRFTVSSIALRENFKNLTSNIFWACFPLAIAYALNPFLLFFGIKMMGKEGSAFGALAFALMATVVAIWVKNWGAISLKSTRGLMNLVGFGLVLLKVSDSVFKFLNGSIGTNDIMGMILIIVGVISFSWYAVKLPTVIGRKIDGVKMGADSIIFVASIISSIGVGLYFISQFAIGNIDFESIKWISIITFVLVGLWQGVVCTIRFQRRFAEARDEKNCGVVRASAFNMLLPAVGVVLSLLAYPFGIGSFSVINIIIAIALFVVVGIFVSSKEFDSENKKGKSIKKTRKKKKKKAVKKITEKKEVKKTEKKEIEKKEVGKVEDKKIELVAKDKKSEDLNDGDVIQVRVIGGKK